MAQRVRHKNESLLNWVRATAVTAAVYAALLAMHFAPGWGAALLALIAGGLTLAAVDLGVLAAVVALSLPIMAANATLGLLFLILGIVGIRYLGADGGRAFFIVGIAVVGAFFGPGWAAVAIAGLLLGAGEGALAAAIAAVSVEALGLFIGRSTIGVVITGGTAPGLLNFAKAPESLFSAAWIAESFGKLDTAAVNATVDAVAKMSSPSAMLLQPLTWAAGAALTGYVVKLGRERKSLVIEMGGVVAGIAVPALGAAIIPSIAGLEADWPAIVISVIGSAGVALLVAAVTEKVFPLEVVPAPVRQAPAPSPSSMASEDADVDELLRLISTAEERLASQHTTQRVVMLTDMKSFSRMTEEDGSVLTAKAIQRHRDLLLPVVERNGGHGKSTGGDGLVAAFTTPRQAVLAAAEMQRTLSDYNANHPSEREMAVRIGIADGEVVLDKGGRPFIGAALNLAARVMNLADGGQAFVSATVAANAQGVAPTHSHGSFELKNIAAPVEVLEILWADDQEPVDPRTRTDSSD